MNSKLRVPFDQVSRPVWCPKCLLRIAPYETKTLFGGEEYHRHCLEKMVAHGEVIPQEGWPHES